MPTPQQLLAQIRSTLGPALSPSLNSASDTSDLFEAYVFSIVIDAARIEGATVRYADINNASPSLFIFRTSPGHIYSRTQPYSYAVLEFPSKPVLEAHLGVRVAGRSQVLHEFDVCVVEEDEADFCRRSGVAPKSSSVLIAVECKFYSTSIALHLAREFIGLTTDISTSNCYFVTNSESESVEKLLSARKKIWETDLEPNMTVNVERLRNKFQTAFQNFKAVR